MNIDSVLGELIDIIKTSPEFSRLKQAKAVLSKNPNLERKLEEFNLSQKQLFSGKLPTKDVEIIAQQLNTKFESLSKILEVRNYLDALNALNQIMIKINNSINVNLEKSLS